MKIIIDGDSKEAKMVQVSDKFMAALDSSKDRRESIAALTDKLFESILNEKVTVEVAECALDRARVLIRTRTIVG